MRMKRVLALLLVASLLSTLTPLTAVEAKSSKSYGYLDKKTNRTYVPLRFLSEQLDYKVLWDQKSQSVAVSNADTSVTLVIGEKHAAYNNETIELDAAPFVKNGTTYVPIRFIGDVMQLDLTWNKESSSLQLYQDESLIKLPVIPLDRSVQSNPVEQLKQPFEIGKKRVSATVLKVDLLHSDIKLDVAVANNKPGSVDSLKDMATVNGAAIAMNGTYFDAYSNSNVKVPYGYIVQDGKVVYKSSGDKKSVLLFTKQNEVEIVSGVDFPQRLEAGDVYGALQVGPRLITNGQITVDPVSEGFKDPKILSNTGARSAVGITSDHKLILLTVSGVTIPELAKIMKQAGAYQAMNMDGGASSGLYYNGKYLTQPGRELSNALLIHTP